MSDDLTSGLAATANEPTADTSTPDSVLDAAFASPEPSASSDPTPDPEPVSEPVAATSQPQPTATSEQPSKGEPPRERWDSILANARTKARDEALAEHREALEIVKSLRENFTGTLAQLLDEASADPRFAPDITAKAAAILNARKGQAKADAEPEPDLQTGDGALVYSAEQLRKWHDWNSRQLEKKFGEQFRPLQELQQQFTTTRERLAMQQQAMETAKQRGARWESMPFFTEHKDAILERQKALYAESPQADPWELLQQAYSDVIPSVALPKLAAQQTGNLVAQAARKRAGSSSDPASMMPAQPRKPRTPDEALDMVFNAAFTG